MTRHTIDEDVRRELVAIIERDHAQANDFIARLVTLRTAIATLAGSLWTATIAAGLTSHHRGVFVVGAVLVLVLAVLDLSYSAHYRTLRTQVRRLERALNANYNYVFRSVGKRHSAAALERAFAQVEVGQIAPLRPQRYRALKEVRQAADYRTLLLLSLAAVALLTALFVDAAKPEESTCFRGGRGTILRSGDQPKVVKGVLEVVRCP